MHINEFSPGERIVLEHRAGDPIPPGVPGCAMVGVVVLIMGFATVAGGAIAEETGEEALVMALIFGGVLSGLALYGMAASGTDYVSRLTIERGGDMRFEVARAGKPVDSVVLPTSGLREIRIIEDARALGGHRSATEVMTSLAKSTGSRIGATPLRLSLFFETPEDRAQAAKPRFEKLFWVEDVDTRQEVLDIGKRIASAAGAAHGEINRADPRKAEFRFYSGAPAHPIDPARAIDMAAEFESAADMAERYKADVVAHDGRLDGTIVPAWDPFQHPLEASLVEYVENSRVIFEERFSGCAYCAVLGIFSVLGVMGGGFYAAMSGGHDLDILKSVGMGLAVGAGLGTMLAKWLQGRPPKRWEVDLSARSLRYSDPRSDETTDLSQVREVVLRRHHWVTRSKNSTTHWYKCYTEIVLPDASAANGERRIIVGWTNSTAGRDEPSYEAGVPYAGMVAGALGVPMRYEEPN